MGDEKLSPIVGSQFPSFVRREGPRFVAFLKAYYEWLEQEGNSRYQSQRILDYRDIDKTTTDFINYFKNEILASFPADTLADKRLLVKQIKDFYRSKGSEKSYNFLFRVLYDEDIDFYYPGEDILRASDGRWVEENSIRVGYPFSGSIEDLDGELVTGQTSGAQGRVERISKTIESGITVNELFLINIVGTFVDGETITTENSPTFFTVFSSIGPITTITDIFDGGAFHVIGDDVNLQSDSGVGGRASITATGSNSAVKFFIDNGGAGYTVNTTITVSGGSGEDADFRVESISNTEFIELNSDPIYPMRNVSLDESPTFTSGGANTASVNPDLASANIDTLLVDALTFTNTEVGTISSILMIDHGFGYDVSLPSATAVFVPVSALDIPDPVNGGFKGRNAEFHANNVGGTITALSILDGGIGYNINETVRIINIDRTGTDDGAATIGVSGIVEYDGKYIDTKGWLSWNNRLQDNFYYQIYSYEIISEQFIKDYRSVVKDIVHPVGTKLFGRVEMNDSIASNTEEIQITTEVSVA